MGSQRYITGQIAMLTALTGEFTDTAKRTRRAYPNDAHHQYARGIESCARLTTEVAVSLMDGDPDVVWESRVQASDPRRTVVNWKPEGK